jgi:two-component system, LytTR family, response regulator
MDIDCIVIEDEPLAIEKIEGFIKQVDYLHLLSAFQNPIDGVSYLKRNSVDLIFLDIKMSPLSGIDVLESVNISSNVIITSAYDEYAIKGYEYRVSDFLLKPFSFSRFLKAVEGIYYENNPQAFSDRINFIFVRSEYRIEKIDLSKILFIQGMSDYLQIQLYEKRILTLLSLRNLMRILPQNEFVRVHKSYIIPISKIDYIERSAIRINEKMIPITTSYKKDFYNIIQKHLKYKNIKT